MPRFVLLYHDCPPNYERASHWDFMLESGDVLRTWVLEQLPRDWEPVRTRTVTRYPNCPAVALENSVPAVQLADHRRDYLTIEGPLSGERGQVIRVAAGTYTGEHEAPDELQVVLSGGDLTANVRLIRSKASEESWTLNCS
jgi:hypothetical protein